mmetsp:Transcript_3722/g.8035  ORF Transcript_3722/g.8035 Transcript_3722/m.8035 type:complete len:516 (-) Transcript_3722:58-1605(-)
MADARWRGSEMAGMLQSGWPQAPLQPNSRVYAYSNGDSGSSTDGAPMQHLANEPWRTTNGADTEAAGKLLPREGFKDSARALSKPLEEASASEDDELVSRVHAFATNVVEHDRFQMLVAGMILLSTLSMIIETDHEDWAGWSFVNNYFLTFFVCEITLRLLNDGICFFCNKDMLWNIFDFTIVVTSVMDLWISPLILGDDKNGGDMTRYIMVLRLVRILRILRTLRVLRILREFPELMKLVQGVIESLEMVSWIGLLMAIIMFIYAILLKEVAGNNSSSFSDPEEIELYFGTIFRAFVTFFQFITLDNWSYISRLVTDTEPVMWIFFMLYVIIQSFAILALLTGVVCDHLEDVGTAQKDEENDANAGDLLAFLDELEGSFAHWFDKGGGGITRERFDKLIKEPSLQVELEAHGVEVAGRESDEFWDFLDTDGNGCLTWSEFKQGIMRLGADPMPKDMLRMRYCADRVTRSLQGQGEAAATRKLDVVTDTMSDAEARLKKLEDRMRHFVADRLREG